MKNRTSRRIAPSSGYIGAGNRTDSFTHKPRKAFQEVAEIYREKLAGHGGKKKNYRQVFNELSVEEKQLIKSKILEERKKQDRLNVIIALILLSVLFCSLIWIMI